MTLRERQHSARPVLVQGWLCHLEATALPASRPNRNRQSKPTMVSQIAVYKTHKQVFDFQDLLEPDAKCSKTCAERSRSIAITLLNYAEGQGAV